MIKKISFLTLTFAFFALGSFAEPEKEVCCGDKKDGPLFCGTDFKPKPGVSKSVYSLDDVIFDDPISGRLSLDATFNPNPSTLKPGEYYIDKDGLHLCVNSNSKLFSYSLSNLNANIHGDYYWCQADIKFVSQGNKPKSHVSQYNLECIGLCGDRTQANPYWYFNDDGSIRMPSYDYPFTFPFKVKNTATSGNVEYTVTGLDPNGSAVFQFKSIKIKGCFDDRIIIENGTNCCKGEENTFTLKSMSKVTSCKWSYSEDGNNWKSMAGTGTSVSKIITEDKVYIKAEYGGKTITAGPISSIICCSAGGGQLNVLKEDFTLKNSAQPSNGGLRDDFKNYFNGKVTTEYKYPPSVNDNLNDGDCAVVDNARVGGYWSNEPIVKGHTGNGSRDGFFLVNCGFPKSNIFIYHSSEDTFCENTLYNFSAWIANLCTNPGDERAPINVKLDVIGKNASGQEKTLLSITTGYLPTATPWTQFNGSFNSLDYTDISFKLVNNVDKEDVARDWCHEGNHCIDEKGYAGNDVGLDDVLFTACAPAIDIIAGGDKSKDIVITDCSLTSMELNGSTAVDLSEYFKTPYYLFQQSTDGKNWTDIGTADKAEKKTVPLDKKTHKDGVYYRIWVGGSAQAIKNGIAKEKDPSVKLGCADLTAVSEPLRISMKCDCEPSPAPVVHEYNECPLPTGGTVDLTTLVDKNKDKLTWYKTATGTDVITNTKIVVDDTKINPTGTAYYVTNTKPNDAKTEYCESERVKVTVKVKDAIKFSVSPLDITTCVYEGADLSYKVSGKTPATAVIEWQDGSATSPTGDTYTIDKKTRGQGTIKLVATDPAKTSCESTQSVTYNLTDVNKFTLKAEPAFVCTGNPVSTITATIVSGEGEYTLYKKVGSGAETKVTSGVVTSADKTVTYEDKSVATVATTVTYRMVFGEGKCQDEHETPVEVGSEFEIPVESSAVSPKDKVCVGSPITLSTTYTPITGEILIWEENGAEIGRGTSVSIAAVNAKTTYTVKNQNGTCDGNGSITIDVDKPIKAVIKSSTPAVCENNPVDLMDTNTEKASQYQW
ncbi:MAG: hypothetical protein MJ010_07845, partial [Paludibacteraceae bacterium]|nr:hypothetical protein [Paludibacteraceae bacterium]